MSEGWKDGCKGGMEGSGAWREGWIDRRMTGSNSVFCNLHIIWLSSKLLGIYNAVFIILRTIEACITP